MEVVPQPHGAACPNCGAPVEFASAASASAVCSFCRSTLVRDGEALRRIGASAELFDDHSPLQLGASGRIFELLDERSDLPQPAQPAPLARAEGRVSFDGVSFTYDGDAEGTRAAVLRDWFQKAKAQLGVSAPDGMDAAAVNAVLIAGIEALAVAGSYAGVTLSEAGDRARVSRALQRLAVGAYAARLPEGGGGA